jgi:serine/threonine protein kinase
MGQIYGERWKIAESLGEGGQAQTFLVTDIRGQGEIRYVLKRLKNLTRIERFKNEVEAIRNLSHENIVSLIDFDLEAEKPYLVMEYCAGGSLSQAKSFWRDSPVRALEIFQQICSGVACAHSHEPPIIHRDLKPDNIYLRSTEGPAVVGDFGICYLEKDGTRITLTEEAVGPRLFMAPELEDGRLDDISPKSDIYSLGKLLYWLLSGGKIFSREKHRDPNFDVYMEHVNRLLDRMIVDDPKKRADIDQVLSLSHIVMRLVSREFNPIAKGVQHPCTYCRYGHYQLRAANSTQVRNFGFNVVGTSDWRMLVCDVCGHVQSFRVDMAQQKEWWE